MIAQFTAKTTNSEKVIYLLSLMTCSINKLKHHKFFICKSFMFFQFYVKKKKSPENGGGGWKWALAPYCPPFPTALILK